MLMVACADGTTDVTSDATAQEPTTAGSLSAMGPGLSISEARASALGGPLLVNGFLVATPSVVQLCESLRESQPPACGGQSLAVQGLELGTLAGLQSLNGVTWSAAPIQLLGQVEGQTLVVDARSRG